MKIKVGEYVRTKKGKIFRYGKGRAYLGKDNKIVKHSFNIKELIEPQDILKYKIKDFNFNSKGIVYEEYDARKGEYYRIINGHRLEEVQIIAILTHKQYERDYYRLEEE
ncbi:MAG: hypothetical protein BHV96_05480 [Clostridium sp. CAG:354_28_25]|jgi:hypothetical protein|nr:MAG: hypothetical protein BHV96_05480 [Clostridium sp. CAG:354_28_25]